MTAFIRFVSVLLTASALTVNVSAAAKPVAGKRVAVQSSKGKVMLPAGYAKMINDFPEPDPKLLEPIPISNVKSPYGRADLVNFFEIVLQSHSELMAAQDEFNRAGENSTHSPEFFEAAKKLAEKRKYQSEATMKSRQKMKEAAETGDTEAIMRYESYLARRREDYHKKKTEKEEISA